MNIFYKTLRIFLSHLTLIKYKIRYGKNFQFHFSDRVAPTIKIRIDNNGSIVLGDKVSLRDYVVLNSTGGIVEIEDHVFMNDFVCINARKNIRICNDTVIGQAVKFYDHDHDYKHNMQKDFICSDVVIGSNTWIGSDVIILRGTSIGDNCVIGAGALVNSKVASGMLYMNERRPNIKMIEI